MGAKARPSFPDGHRVELSRSVAYPSSKATTPRHTETMRLASAFVTHVRDPALSSG
ncbi:MAG: hypothetical protein K0R30_1841 [Ornithinibacter sp.]|jgi:hypothetical protein|nr:hypothetical protein [Ornithinibacter sp.]